MGLSWAADKSASTDERASLEHGHSAFFSFFFSSYFVSFHRIFFPRATCGATASPHRAISSGGGDDDDDGNVGDGDDGSLASRRRCICSQWSSVAATTLSLTRVRPTAPRYFDDVVVLRGCFVATFGRNRDAIVRRHASYRVRCLGGTRLPL